MVEDPDRVLLEAIAGGDESALVELIGRHKERLFRFVYHHVRNEADAAEIVAETFVRVYRRASDFNPRAKVVTWVYTVAINLCHDWHRRRHRWRWFSLFSPVEESEGSKEWGNWAEHIPDTGLRADEVLAYRDDLRRVRDEIDRLPLKLKTPFILHVLEEHSQKACAELLGVSEKTVETRIYRARKLLQAALEKGRDRRENQNPVRESEAL